MHNTFYMNPIMTYFKKRDEITLLSSHNKNQNFDPFESYYDNIDTNNNNIDEPFNNDQNVDNIDQENEYVNNHSNNSHDIIDVDNNLNDSISNNFENNLENNIDYNLDNNHDYNINQKNYHKRKKLIDDDFMDNNKHANFRNIESRMKMSEDKINDNFINLNIINKITNNFDSFNTKNIYNLI